MRCVQKDINKTEKLQLDSSSLVEFSNRLYSDASFFVRFKNRGRPIICPFDKLIDQVPARSSVLDIGCGSGLFLFVLAAVNRLSVGVGVDTDLYSLNVAKKALGRFVASSSGAKRKLQFICGSNLVEILAGFSKFDVVSMIDVMHHVGKEEQKQFFCRALAQVKPGGRLIFKDVTLKPRWRAWVSIIHDLTIAREWISIVSEKDIISWGKQRGFSLKTFVEYNTLLYRHNLIVMKNEM